MQIKCRAFFEVNDNDMFGFYGLPGEAHRRIRHGHEFQFEFDEDSHEIVEVDGRHMVGQKGKNGVKTGWIEAVELPKKKPGRKKHDVDSLDAANISV